VAALVNPAGPQARALGAGRATPPRQDE